MVRISPGKLKIAENNDFMVQQTEGFSGGKLKALVARNWKHFMICLG
jgi:hypothetical protein